MTEQRDEHQPDPDACDRGDDGQGHRQQRAERDEQDHDRGQQPDRLGRTHGRLERAGDHRPAELDAKSRNVDALRRVDERLGRVGRHVARLLVECHRGVRDLAVGADAPRDLIRRVERDDVRDLARPDLGEHRLHRGAHLRVVHALVGREHDVGGVAGSGRKALVQQIERLDGVRLPTAEVVAVRVTDDAAERVQDHEGDDPQGDHHAPPAVAPAGECSERHSISSCCHIGRVSLVIGMTHHDEGM